MGIQGLIGDVTSTAGNSIKNSLNSAFGLLKGAADRIGTFTANIYSGGFAGVSNFNELYAAIDTYSNNVQNAVNEYKANTDISNTFKGSAADELPKFVEATQALLNAYVGLVEEWKTELAQYYEKYTQGSNQLSQNVQQDTQSVVENAQRISGEGHQGVPTGGDINIG